MKQMWKFQVQDDGEGIPMPRFANILSAGIQPDGICIWAAVDTEMPLELRYIEIIATGHNIHSTDLTFIQTVFDQDYVWHVFERQRPSLVN